MPEKSNMRKAKAIHELEQARCILQNAQQYEVMNDMDKIGNVEQEKLAAQIVALDKVTPGGGIAAYCERARILLKASRKNVNPFA